MATELVSWLKEAYPEVFKQYQAVRDIERSVENAYSPYDSEYQKQVREEFMQVYKEWKGKRAK